MSYISVSVFIQKVIKMYIYIFPIFLHDFRVLEKALVAFLEKEKNIQRRIEQMDRCIDIDANQL